MPRVSVVMPAYNAAAYLPEAVRSILEQTFTDFELIVVDDGSTDDGPKILASFDDARLRVVRQENAGVAAALNAGLAEANGEYIARMDADDIAAPHRLAVQVAFLNRWPKIAAVSCELVFIDGDGNALEYGIRRPCSPLAIRRATLLGAPIVHAALLARASFFERYGGYRVEMKHVEDYDLWVRAMNDARFAALPFEMYHCRRHGGSVSGQWSDLQKTNTLAVRERALDQARIGDGLYRRFGAGRAAGRRLCDALADAPSEKVRAAADLDFFTLGAALSLAVMKKRWRVATEIAAEMAGFAAAQPGALVRTLAQSSWRARDYYLQAAGVRPRGRA